MRRALFFREIKAAAPREGVYCVAELAGVRVLNADPARLDGLTGHGRHQGVAARVAGGRRQQKLGDILEPPDRAFDRVVNQERLLLVAGRVAPLDVERPPVAPQLGGLDGGLQRRTCR